MVRLSVLISDFIAPDFEGKLRAAQALGIHNIESEDRFDGARLCDMSGEALERVRSLLIDYNMRIVLISVSVPLDDHEALNLTFRKALVLDAEAGGLLRLQREEGERVAAGGTVAVVGAGTIGILTAQWAQVFGAAKVVFFDVDDDRLALAKEITGCDGVNTRKADAAQAAKELTGGVGFNDVFGVSGAPASFATCFEVTANKAHVCFIGTPTGDVTLTLKQWEMINRRELLVTGSWMSYSSPFPGKAWTLCCEYLSSGRIKFDKRMIHQVYPLEKAMEAFNCYEHPEQVKGRILLVNPE